LAWLTLGDLIAADMRGAPVSRATTVLLGDYIDRGPDSRGVLARLAAGQFPTETLFLRGNHEAMLLDFLADPGTAMQWSEYGGLETMHSYGVDVRGLRQGSSVFEARDALRAALPASHLAFITATKLWHTSGDYFFCHAGVRPDLPLEAQRAEDLLWIREAFLQSNATFGKMIVHGHTPTIEPDIRPNRINIDTGAYVTGRLSCLVLEADTRRFLTAGPRT
jgi:serine/threonine protein phosphatase 1